MSIPRQPAQERSAEEKLRLITPLLTPGMDKATRIQTMNQIASEGEVSYRSLGRYLAAWNAGGFEALKPKEPWNKGKHLQPDLSDEIFQEAVALRKECPDRSVKDIILILELEGRVAKGSISRNTLQRRFQEVGLSARETRRGAAKPGKSSRRFQKEHRNELWQSDIKYGPYLPIGKGGGMKQVYLCVILDDATRYIVSAGFYESQNSDMVEDCLRQAVMRYGKPDMLYVDNGKQYSTGWLKRACQKLNIVLHHTKPYDPEAKGKVEAFNHRVNIFLSEVTLAAPQTLDELNRHLENWLNEYYHKNPHTSLGGISPHTAYVMDTRPLQFVETETLRNAFLHTEKRRADNTGCVSFHGKTFEAGMKFASHDVEIVYDPAYLNEIEVRMNGVDSVKAHPQVIAPYCDYEKNPVSEGAQEEQTAPQGSRMLDALNKANITHRTNAGIATSFRKAKNEVNTDV